MKYIGYAKLILITISEASFIFFIKNFLHLFFNWRKIALQCCVGFCHTTMWVSHNYICSPSLLSLPLVPPPHPSRSSQRARLDSLSYIATSHQLSLLHMRVYICQCYFFCSSHPLLPLPDPQVFLYICVSIPSLQIGSSKVSFFVNSCIRNSVYWRSYAHCTLSIYLFLLSFIEVQYYMLSVYNNIHNFNGYTPFIAIIKYRLHSLYCTICPYSLLIDWLQIWSILFYSVSNNIHIAKCIKCTNCKHYTLNVYICIYLNNILIF